MEKKAAKKGISRRALLKGIAATALAGGLAAYLAYTRPWHVSYQRWYDQNLAGLKGREFTHPEFHKERIPSENDKAYFEEQFKPHKSNFEMIKKVTYHEGKLFTEFPADDNVFREFESRTKKVTEKFFSSLGIRDELPKLAFHRFTSQMPLAKEHGVLHCYIVGTMKDCVIANYHGVVKDGREGGIRLTYFESVGGNLESIDRIMFVGKDAGFRFEEEEVRRAFIAAADNSVPSYTSVPAEALHYLIRAVRRDYGLEDLNRWWHENGKPKQVTGEQMRVFIKEWLHREEGVVHGLLDDFLEKQQAREGFREYDMKKYLHAGGNDAYRYVPRVRAALKTTTPAALLTEYRTNPRTLFAHR